MRGNNRQAGDVNPVWRRWGGVRRYASDYREKMGGKTKKKTLMRTLYPYIRFVAHWRSGFTYHIHCVRIPSSFLSPIRFLTEFIEDMQCIRHDNNCRSDYTDCDEV